MSFLKSNLQKIIVLLISVFIFTACNKDVDVVEDYSFTITTTFADTGFVDKEQLMTLVITPTKDIADTTYSFSFEVTGGQGVFKKTDDVTINVGDSEEIPEETTLNYLPSTDGVHEITIKVRNSNNYEEEKQISYTVLPNIPCSFNFTSATFAETETPHPGIVQDINFVITQDATLECGTVYNMEYQVKRDGLDVSGTFLYQEEPKFQNTPFIISTATGTSNTIADFAGKFETSPGDGIGTYEVIFTITNTALENPEEATQIQTATLAYENPPVTIAMTSTENTVYAKQTATYNASLSGGGTAGTYEIKVTADDANLGAVLEINGTPIALDTFVVVTDPTNVIINLRPEETGGSTSFTVTAMKNETETGTTTILLTSEVPEFEMGDLVLDPTSIPLGDDTSTLTIPITLLDGYAEDLTYTYSIPTNVTSSPDASSGFDFSATPTPDQTFEIGYSGGLASDKLIEVTVTNQYGYSVIKEVTLIVTD
ncbi:MAG: TraQ conjugal transfer family protein [Flavobacteriaceae bacterium]|nr:TraQ conjugal transfer family protein [Flavobacteriaceae bacterium]